jgi:hypothetical protein
VGGFPVFSSRKKLNEIRTVKKRKEKIIIIIYLTFILCNCSDSSPTHGGGLTLVFKSVSPSRAAVYKHN